MPNTNTNANEVESIMIICDGQRVASTAADCWEVAQRMANEAGKVAYVQDGEGQRHPVRPGA